MLHKSWELAYWSPRVDREKFVIIQVALIGSEEKAIIMHNFTRAIFARSVNRALLIDKNWFYPRAL